MPSSRGKMAGPSVNSASLTLFSGLAPWGVKGCQERKDPSQVQCSHMKTPALLPLLPSPIPWSSDCVRRDKIYTHQSEVIMICAKCVVYLLINKHLLSLLGTRHWAKQEGYRDESAPS